MVKNDISHLKEILQTECKIPQENIQILENEKATVEGFRTSLRGLASAAKDEYSTVWIYFSGHGGSFNTGHYLCTYEIDVDNPEDTSLSGNEFIQLVSDCKAPRVMVFLDSCHAGGISGIKSVAVARGGYKEEFLESLLLSCGKGNTGSSQKSIFGSPIPDKTGMAILSSCKSNESSYILDGDKNSLFTIYLLNALRGEAGNTEGVLSILDLIRYVESEVPKRQPKQNPVFKASGSNFPVVTVPIKSASTQTKESKYPTQQIIQNAEKIYNIEKIDTAHFD